MLTNLWQTISNLGIKESKDDLIKFKRRILFNRIIFVLFSLNCIFLIFQIGVVSFIFLSLEKSRIDEIKPIALTQLVYQVLATSFFVWMIYMVSKGYYELSLKIYLLISPLFTTLFALSFGPKIDSHFIFLACYLQVLMFCDESQGKLKILSMLNITLFLVITIVSYHVIDFSRLSFLPERNYLNVFMIIFVTVILINEMHKITAATESALHSERKKADDLLGNILPEKAIQELKEKGVVTPVYFSSASILFTDFKGFTSIAEKMSPTELIRELDICFSQFDSIIRRNNLEKLKTIGDSYMCAGGIPTENKSHAVDCVLAALEIQRLMKEIKLLKSELGIDYWELRLGIHSGPVIAGVIGENKFAYDIWGDTVNTASRMESSGNTGEVNISESTFELIKDFFDCEFRGEVNAKNKGNIRMYFVKKIKPEFSVNQQGIVPNKTLLSK